MFSDNLYSNEVYTVQDIDTIVDKVMFHVKHIKNTKKVSYYNVASAFDIETSSFMVNDEKLATMYVWQFGLDGCVIVGRTWGEFSTLCRKLVDKMKLSVENRLIVFVHNLSYEFQWIRRYFEWEKVFSIDTRKPIYAITKNGIEFRCSYLLSGYALASLGKNLHDYPIEKKVGDLDYSKIRHSTTPLTNLELGYCVNDVKVVMSYIQEQINQNGDITKIPLTKTGVVRRYCREKCFKEDGVPQSKSKKAQHYHAIMNSLKISSPKEYDMLKRAFQGGFTHASVFYSGKEVKDVASFDFTSSYPTVMIAERFPMSSGELVTIKNGEDFKHNLDLYCCVFDVHFVGLECKTVFENYLSLSHCYGVSHPTVNNGRVVRADELYTTITDVDFKIIKECYTWQRIEVGNFFRYRRGYLPTDLVKSILDLYKDKTTLKGVPDEEVNYMLSKGMLNSVYGCAVTDIIRPLHEYTTDWNPPVVPDKWDELEKYNKSRSRFLFYPWGVFVCAYARYNVWTGILEFGKTGDYVYCDTDSIKVFNYENHREYLNKYNHDIIEKLYTACDYHKIPRDMIEPKTIKGEKKPLGVWDFEGVYTRFKTLGAKRYMVEHDGEINITVSGLNKKVCVPYLIDTYGDKVFDAFCDEMYIPSSYTGKNTHTYIDEPTDGVIIDYLGNVNEFHELSSIHMTGADYSMSIARQYADYIMQVQEMII